MHNCGAAYGGVFELCQDENILDLSAKRKAKYFEIRYQTVVCSDNCALRIFRLTICRYKFHLVVVINFIWPLFLQHKLCYNESV